jgi:hypothetical protein
MSAPYSIAELVSSYFRFVLEEKERAQRKSGRFRADAAEAGTNFLTTPVVRSNADPLCSYIQKTKDRCEVRHSPDFGRQVIANKTLSLFLILILRTQILGLLN